MAVPTVTHTSGEQNEEPISDDNLLNFLVGKCGDDMRQRIAHERKIVGSAVQLWFADLDAKLDDPLNLDLAGLGTGGTGNVAEEGTRQADSGAETSRTGRRP